MTRGLFVIEMIHNTSLIVFIKVVKVELVIIHLEIICTQTEPILVIVKCQISHKLFDGYSPFGFYNNNGSILQIVLFSLLKIKI